jgi:predicted SAM-dependent methyltransferase
MTANNAHVWLNLGCGLCTHPDWVNIDGSWNARLARHPLLRKTLCSLHILTPEKAGVPWSRDIFIHDIRKPLPFSDCSVDVVYASHVLEHLYREQAEKLILDSFRVLVPGGIVRIIVPDLRAIIQEYERDSSFGELSPTKKSRPPADLFNERLLMRSPSAPKSNFLLRVYEAWEDFHSHKWMYDEQSLKNLLSSAGFADLARKDYADSSIARIKDVEDASRIQNGAGVCIEGRKR